MIRRIGQLWGHDYSVHKGVDYPVKKEDVREKMWLWFRKRDCEGGKVKIDLENFLRGTKRDPTLGVVLYSAMLNDRFRYDQFQRITMQSREAFSVSESIVK